MTRTTAPRASACGRCWRSLATDQANGIDRILTGDELKRTGGFPDAAFLVLLTPGFVTGAALTGPLLTPSPGKGTHGYTPDLPAMRSSFFAMGPGIAHGHALGVVDMRRIAPTVAGVLGVSLPSAGEQPLPLR